jgi:hypothetical protein
MAHVPVHVMRRSSSSKQYSHFLYSYQGACKDEVTPLLERRVNTTVASWQRQAHLVLWHAWWLLLSYKYTQ